MNKPPKQENQYLLQSPGCRSDEQAYQELYQCPQSWRIVGEISGQEKTERNARLTDLAEPEDLLSRFGVAFVTHPDVQSLIYSDGTWLVSRIGWHRAMTHLHKLNLLELGQFLRVGRGLASRCAGRGSVIV